VIVAPPGRILARRREGVEVAAADRALLVRKVRLGGRIVPATQAMPPRAAYLDRLPAQHPGE
jgi:hypothetical protein